VRQVPRVPRAPLVRRDLPVLRARRGSRGRRVNKACRVRKANRGLSVLRVFRVCRGLPGPAGGNVFSGSSTLPDLSAQATTCPASQDSMNYGDSVNLGPGYYRPGLRRQHDAWP
jgi:hypothetical protein